MLGYTLAYNTLDNNKNPTAGVYAEFKQDFAGIGGDVNFIRSTVDTRTYYEMFSDVVGVLHLQGGHIAGWGGSELRMLDHFQMGPNLVRGFAPSGIGPRDLTSVAINGLWRSAGRHACTGAPASRRRRRSTSCRRTPASRARYSPMPDRCGTTGDRLVWPRTGETLTPAPTPARSAPSVGVGLIWNSPFGPLRFDYSFPLAKQSYDRIQQFRFGGGTKF